MEVGWGGMAGAGDVAHSLWVGLASDLGVLLLLLLLRLPLLLM